MLRHLLLKDSGENPKIFRPPLRFLGGTDFSTEPHSADLALLFNPLPRVPIRPMFWDEDKKR